MDRWFLSVLRVVLTYPGAFGLPDVVSVAETPTKDIVDDMIPSRYLPKHSRSMSFWYVRLDRQVTKNADELSLLQSLNEGQEDGKELKILHLDGKGRHATRDSFVVLPIEAVDFYINNTTSPGPFTFTALIHLVRCFREKTVRAVHQD